MTDEEFKAEARRRGYKLIKVPEKVETVKLLPCICGRKLIRQWCGSRNHVNFTFYACPRCELRALDAESERQARINWNAKIKEMTT